MANERKKEIKKKRNKKIKRKACITRFLMKEKEDPKGKSYKKS